MYGCTVRYLMIIRSVTHRGLRRLIEENDTRGIRTDLVDRVRKILAVLIVAENMDQVQGPPGWRIHQLSGDRRGTWSISVSGNWRVTFDVDENEIYHLNLEDYH
jgi:proteic killer suppression protein